MYHFDMKIPFPLYNGFTIRAIVFHKYVLLLEVRYFCVIVYPHSMDNDRIGVAKDAFHIYNMILLNAFYV